MINLHEINWSKHMDHLFALLKSEYGINAESISPAPGGFSTKAAYHVTDVNGIEYFIKIYDKMLPTTRYFVERIDSYMPALDWLSASPELTGRVLAPVKAFHGAYKVETDDDVYIAFLYVNGYVPGIQGITREQTIELAEALAAIHEISGVVPLDMTMLSEDLSLPFCDQLAQYLSKPDTKQNVLSSIVSQHSDLLSSAIREIYRLCDTAHKGYSHLVLCHGDAHGNNVIQGKRLVLVDWEDLRLAPAEADLFIHAWHPHGDLLLESYSAARHGYQVNHELLFFYVLCRRIEDVWVDIQRLTEELPDKGETEKILGWTQLGIEEINGLMLGR
jgi:thiamine kinase-like enzyme